MKAILNYEKNEIFGFSPVFAKTESFPDFSKTKPKPNIRSVTIGISGVNC